MSRQTRCCRAWLALIAVALFSVDRVSGQCESAWAPLATGIERAAAALLIFDDGSGPSLYAGGSFTNAGGNSTKRVARWDGQQWQALGDGFEQGNYSGLPTSAVLTLAEFDDGKDAAVYAGGSFVVSGNTIVNAIARWDGAQWQPLGEGLRIFFMTDVTAVATDILVFDDGRGDALYAAGSFDHAGGQTIINIARWDGSSWSDVGGGAGFDLRDWVSEMIVFDDGSGESLYVAGGFATSGATPLRNIARWDGLAWTPVGAGLEFPVSVLAVLDEGAQSALYAIEEWRDRSGGFLSRLSRWNGKSWTLVDPRLEGQIHSLIAFDDGTGPTLVAGTGAEVNPGLIKWDGNAWVPYLGGVQGPRFSGVRSLVQGSLGTLRTLFVAGFFSDVGQTVSATNIAKWRTCVLNCYPDCDTSTGVGVLDLFDFLCFQDSFVNSEAYACDCDTSTGQLVCDLFDFLCFQDAFVSGCP